MHKRCAELPFERMIFIGDGDTDIPSMKMVTEPRRLVDRRARSAEWRDPEHQQKTHTLIAESRVNFVAPADYTENSQLAVVVRGILDRIARAERVHPAFFDEGAFNVKSSRPKGRRT